jgi:hypothetical protein
MTKRFETETRATEPIAFREWLAELGEIADEEGSWMLIMAWMYAPHECCAYLMTLPGVVEMLLARARYADAKSGAALVIVRPSGTL